MLNPGKRGKEILLEKGVNIILQGDYPENVFWLEEGNLEVYHTEPNDTIRALGQIFPGEFFGEMAAITGTTSVTSIRTLSASKIRSFEISDFFELLEEEPELNRHLLRTMAERSQRLYKEMKNTRIIWVRPWSTGVDVKRMISKMIPYWEVYGKCVVINYEEWKAIPDESVKSFRKSLSNNYHYIFLYGSFTHTEWVQFCASETGIQMCIADPNEQALETEKHDNENEAMELVLLHPDRLNRPNGTAKWLDTAPFQMHYHIITDSPDDMNRLARCFTGNAIGLVCTGGGARGVTHLGIIHSFNESRIPVDYLVGTSAGALFTVCHCMDMPYTEAMHFLDEVFKSSDKLNDYTFPFLSMLEGKNFYRIIENYSGDWQIEDLWLPFACVSASLTNGRVYVHKRGLLSTALKATSAIPGLLPPVALNGELLVDGGVLNNAPTDIAQTFPKGKTMLCDISQQKTMYLKGNFPDSNSGWNMVLGSMNPLKKNKLHFALPSILLRSFEMAADAIHSEKIRTHAPFLYINPPVEGLRTLDYYAVKQAFEKGYAFGIENSEKWRKALDIKEF